jgi:AraC-like DNA-binding protein
LTVCAGLTMDAFSEILSGLKLNGALYFSAEFSAPWSFSSPPAVKLSELLGIGEAHLVIYHFLIEGEALVTADEQTVELEPGDVVILPHGNPHQMTSGKGAIAAMQSSAILAKIKARDLRPVQAGGGGDAARFACGYMACDPYISRPILAGLPPIFKVNIRTDRSGQWLESSILHLVDEAGSGQVGSAAMLAKLSEALFVDTLRRYIAGLPNEQMGWLAGARDTIVGKSLGLLHSRIAHPWTIADLADEVGISRSALVERFTRYLSEPPMTYLARWRLQLAARSLETTSRGVAEIAAEVGYESEAAFNRAFKREFGRPPGRYRRDYRGPERQRPFEAQARKHVAGRK